MNKISKQFCIHGHDTFICGRDTTDHCKDCGKDYREKKKAERSEKMKEYYSKNRDKILKQKKEYTFENATAIAIYQEQYRIENEENLRIQRLEYYEINKEYIIARNKKYAQEHPEIGKVSDLKKKTNRNLRVVSWGQEGTKEFIRNCPQNKTIDHYVPLQGKKVSGLHVIWNLQYLTFDDNNKKGNRINLLEASEWYGKLLENMGLK